MFLWVLFRWVAAAITASTFELVPTLAFDSASEQVRLSKLGKVYIRQSPLMYRYTGIHLPPELGRYSYTVRDGNILFEEERNVRALRETTHPARLGFWTSQKSMVVELNDDITAGT